MSYTKVFPDLLRSSINDLDPDLRWVWLAMLILKDKDGHVQSTLSGLAREANIAVDRVSTALELFQRPDTSSKCQDADGARIVAVPGGWKIVAHKEWRDVMDMAERRAYKAQWVADKRASRKLINPQMSTGVDRLSTESTHADADADADAEKKKKECAAHGTQQLLIPPVDIPAKPARKKRAKKEKPPADPRDVAFCESFRCDWIDTLRDIDPETDDPFVGRPISDADLDAARKFRESDWTQEQVEDQLTYILRDPPRPPDWPGWAHNIKCVAKWWDKRFTLRDQIISRDAKRRAE